MYMLRVNSGFLCKGIDGLLVYLFELYKIVGFLFFILIVNLSIFCVKFNKMYLGFFLIKI